MQIILTVEEATNAFFDALCNVYGSGWWNGYGLRWEWDNEAYMQARAKLTNCCVEDILMQILKDGGTLTIVDDEGEGEMTRSIKMEDIIQQISNMPADRLINVLQETGEIEDDDVLLQTIFFGEVVFG